MKIKTSELTRHALDWAVCAAKGWVPTVRSKVECQNELTTPVFLGDQEQRPSTNWAQGGPIIENLSRQGLRITGTKCRYATDAPTFTVSLEGYYKSCLLYTSDAADE